MELYFLKNYCNYFNRQVKYRETLEQYLEDREQEDYFIVHNANFNPNDGVTTEHIVGNAQNPFNRNWSPDYLLVVELVNGLPIIRSRWYVLDFPRIMGTQNNAILKRDEACDLYDPLLDAPTYIKKATLSNLSPLIVNSEGMNLNQRKVAEYKLRDKSKIPWVVVYIAHNAAKDGIEVKTNVPKNISDIETDTSAEGQLMRRLFKPSGTFTTESDNTILMDLNMKMYFKVYQYISIIGRDEGYAVTLGKRDANRVYIQGVGNENNDPIMPDYFDVGTGNEGRAKENTNNLSSNLFFDYSNFWNYIKSKHPELTQSEIIDHDIPRLTPGKIWRYGQNYYELVEDNYYEETQQIYFESVQNDYLYNKVNSAFSDVLGTKTPAIGLNRFKFWDAKVKHVRYHLEIKAGINATLDIKAGRIHPEEVPYDIIAFPYGDIYVNGSGWNKNVDSTASLATARSIAVELAQGCYDVQILPYCPVLDQYIGSDGEIYLGDAVKNVDYCVVKEGNVNKTLGFYAHSIYQSLTGDNAINKLFDGEQELNVRDICRISGDGRKVDNECDMWRLCAPNFMSQFEFKLTKTLDLVEGAEMDHFDVDITYRPYQPYIRVAPQFGFLYVRNYNDARGLICTAGFSITLIDDKWQTYELNNKNYQAMFNREITHMENERAIAREQEQWQLGWQIGDLVKGQLNDAPIAGFSGFMKSGPIGGIVSSVGAGINSLYGGAKGISSTLKGMEWSERSYQEIRDMKMDMFNMSLDNIRALPSSITQSSSISYNFKFFPVLEKYTCTDPERELVKKKLRWNGMTVGLIATVREYISAEEERYVQGEIIRLENTNEDSHIVNSLYQELNKGLFFTPYIPQNKKEVA